MTQPAARVALTRSLEDYLETIYELVRQNRYARVRDIARARDVKAGSVSPAMRRLADLGLIEYHQREYIGLTPEGEEEGRRIFARHQVLTRFFTDFLQLPADVAREDACSMEHSLSDGAMDRLVRLFEFLSVCPDARSDFLDRFHHCPVVQDDAAACDRPCDAPHRNRHATEDGRPVRRLSDVAAGERAVVRQVDAHGELRQRLLDKGVLPESRLRVVALPPAADGVRVQLGGFELTLDADEAAAVRVVAPRVT
jgi:DtxR family Mn-dependent transcriptional regulator